jgi:N-acetyl-anhydromuramyl-L-alanine amidase AmpD
VVTTQTQTQSFSEPFWYPGAVHHPIFNHSLQGVISQRDLIVLHITEGVTASGAIRTFETSVAPKRVSAHFVIDRDKEATIYQLLPISDTAWHASAVNLHSIGIEHVALSQQGADNLNWQNKDRIAAGLKPWIHMPATPEQYAASAKLIAWLAGNLRIPVDRQHVRTHNEASPADGHTLCCTGALDPDWLVGIAQQMAKLGISD